jgi:glycosyltransferase involved in cell wall biosynthesis
VVSSAPTFTPSTLNCTPATTTLSDAVAVTDTVPDTAGLLVPPDDASAFAGALRSVLTDAILRDRLARGSAARGAGLPSWADTAAIMGAVLDRVRVL